MNRNTIFKYDNDEFISNFIPDEKTIINILQMFCENSIYSYQSQICNGFITIFGGHRVGITGNIAMRDGKISNINYVSSLNIIGWQKRLLVLLIVLLNMCLTKKMEN